MIFFHVDFFLTPDSWNSYIKTKKMAVLCGGLSKGLSKGQRPNLEVY
jgi:hypothetical protein